MRSTIVEPKVERAVIEINGGCNYTCQMCPQTNPGRHKGFLRTMKLDEFEGYVLQCVDRGVKVVNLEGSGEATLVRKLPEYIKILTKHNVLSYIFSNGFKFRNSFMEQCVDAGLSRLRFSIIGYNASKYKEWMNRDAFDFVKKNAIEAQEYISKTNGVTELASYHLITDNDQLDFEIEEYKKNWIEPTGTLAEIWKMHNWSGQLDVNWRQGAKKRSCGRPFSPDLIVRAGGNDGKQGAVVPCCMVLGQDSKAVLGHLSEQSIEEIWYGEKYEHLRQMHREHRFDEIDYCKDCDMLYDTPEALVWSNYEEADYSNMTGSTENMINLAEYRI